MFRLDDKIAVVTGGASGIGRAISILFADQGAKVYIIDIHSENANAVVEEIKLRGGLADFRICDLSNTENVIPTIDSILAESEKVDVLVNNAAIAHIGNAENTSIEDFQRLLQVNITGVYAIIHALLPNLKQKGGVILNMASVAATVGLADRFAYSTTKGAIKTMTISIAKDFIKDNIRCNSISPGRVHTPFVDGYLAKNYPGQEAEYFEKLSKTQPIGRMAKPEEIAHLALFLCSDEASFITGCDYPIDGGFITLNT